MASTSLDLQKMNLIPLSENEMKENSGGSWWEIFEAVYDAISEGLPAMKQGAGDGYQDGLRMYPKAS